MSAPTEVPVRDAATVLLLRGDTPAEVFLVRRTRKAAFMANAMVFPGGRLDDADADDALAARCDLSRAQAAARLDIDDGARALALLIAGVRETFEEAGVLLARRGDAPLTFADPTEAARFDAHRDALNAGATTLTAIAEAEDLTLATADLRYQARWITPPIEKRRFDARFFAVRAPAGQRPLHEGVETTASAWMTPRATVGAYRNGDLELAPPTLRILDELAALGSVEAILAHRVTAPAALQPQPSFVDGGLLLLLPGDPAFDPPGAAPNRIVLRDGRWHSEGRGY